MTKELLYWYTYWYFWSYVEEIIQCMAQDTRYKKFEHGKATGSTKAQKRDQIISSHELAVILARKVVENRV